MILREKMKDFAERALSLLKKSEAEIRKQLLLHGGAEVIPASIHKLGGSVLMIIREQDERRLLVVADYVRMIPERIEGEKIALSDGGVALLCPLDAVNAAALRRHFPWTCPRSLRACRTTIGCGDRLGLAAPGQLRAVRRFGVSPVLAQQSVRELGQTGRTFRSVIDDVVFEVFACDYRDGYGADGDHLKSFAEIETALEAGVSMVTLDLSDVLDPAADALPENAVDKAFAKLPGEQRSQLLQEYVGKTFVLNDFNCVTFDALSLKRCVLIYGAALDFTEKAYGLIRRWRGSEFDLEVSIDETGVPTSPLHHLFIARELRKRNVEFTSLAPRFVGEFQKGIDYIGDLAEFERQFKLHVSIAETYGQYKLSIHSGSDKFRVFPVIGRETGGYLHLKTAGTSWLVAVEVIARKAPELYRRMHAVALEHFDAMCELYHITADVARIPAVDSLDDAGLANLMELPDARQLLHITYGPILAQLGMEVHSVLERESEAYDAALERHFVRHLAGLGLKERILK